MNLREVLESSAEAARGRRRWEYYKSTGEDPDTVDKPVLTGYCYENARALSFELTERDIPHRVVYGGILGDFLQQPFYKYTTDGNVPDDFDPLEYTTEGEPGYDPAIWDVIGKPQTPADVPDEANHYWIEVDIPENSWLPLTTDNPWHAEIAAEARHKYGEVFVTGGHPERHYIKPDDCYVDPEWSWLN